MLMAWLLRVALAGMAGFGLVHGLPLWWVPALAVGCSIISLACAFGVNHAGARILGRAAMNIGTLCAITSLPVAVWWAI